MDDPVNTLPHPARMAHTVLGRGEKARPAKANDGLPWRYGLSLGGEWVFSRLGTYPRLFDVAPAPVDGGCAGAGAVSCWSEPYTWRPGPLVGYPQPEAGLRLTSAVVRRANEILSGQGHPLALRIVGSVLVMYATRFDVEIALTTGAARGWMEITAVNGERGIHVTDSGKAPYRVLELAESAVKTASREVEQCGAA